MRRTSVVIASMLMAVTSSDVFAGLITFDANTTHSRSQSARGNGFLDPSLYDPGSNSDSTVLNTVITTLSDNGAGDRAETTMLLSHNGASANLRLDFDHERSAVAGGPSDWWSNTYSLIFDTEFTVLRDTTYAISGEYEMSGDGITRYFVEFRDLDVFRLLFANRQHSLGI